MANIETLKIQFIEHYGGQPSDIEVFHAPGRVNLIGEHTDYNGGYVFPAALTFGTTLLIRGRKDRGLGLASTNFQLSKLLSIDSIAYDKSDEWMNYPKGIVHELHSQGIAFSQGYDLLYHGEIPNGSGLSSSASIEVVTAYALLSMEGLPLNKTKIALLSQKSENEFNGVKCGIMDQFAVANGLRDHAMLLMCDTLKVEQVPFRTGSYRLVIANTNKQRGLADSKYNERRAECEKAVEELRAVHSGLELLGQLSAEQFHSIKHLIQDDTVRRRAQHVVEENERVLQSVKALNDGDLERFGQLMNASHQSLRDLYEVTGHELDALADAAREVPGVVGSRMTGAGFGGCTVSLVHEDSVALFQEEVGRLYTEATGLKAEFYVCSIGNGVERLEA
ncbi:galactokinase [Paenibacillus sp. 1011MAR3C5]|uniref:galactokinase n=1 Tax=Paenibacillus sp. 1011MAR3C5 TaxID=1675787 RepID=UPI000E6B6B94|nr:galactokinase [Paenibacillus sp. 1011MAR3C5]RJE87650.1 galactokinase [Paenibacillus sp. 1011MAR3C5]